MTQTQFYRMLVLFSIPLFVILFWLHQIPLFRDSLNLSLICLVFFIALSIAVFYVSRRLSRHTNKYYMAHLIMALVFVKLFCCLLILIVYTKIFSPGNRAFIVPFIIIYLTYTIFEVIIMTKSNKVVPQKGNQTSRKDFKSGN